MDNDKSKRRYESVFSRKVRAGKRRTYFFDVRRTKGDDFYITLTESTRRFNGDGYDRHKIFLYKEDFNRFIDSLAECIDHVKTDLMPDYDYDEFTRRQQEWEEKKRKEREEQENHTPSDKEESAGSETEAQEDETESDAAEDHNPDTQETSNTSSDDQEETSEETSESEVEEDDMTW